MQINWNSLHDCTKFLLIERDMLGITAAWQSALRGINIGAMQDYVCRTAVGPACCQCCCRPAAPSHWQQGFSISWRLMGQSPSRCGVQVRHALCRALLHVSLGMQGISCKAYEGVRTKRHLRT